MRTDGVVTIESSDLVSKDFLQGKHSVTPDSAPVPG
jgi:hypothetical protein